MLPCSNITTFVNTFDILNMFKRNKKTKLNLICDLVKKLRWNDRGGNAVRQERYPMSLMQIRPLLTVFRGSFAASKYWNDLLLEMASLATEDVTDVDQGDQILFQIILESRNRHINNR